MKRKSRSAIAVLVAAILVVSLLAGCGTAKKEESSATVSTAADTQEVSKPVEKYVLDLVVRDKKVVAKWSDTRIGKLIGEKFNMDFNLTQFSGDYEQKEAVWLAGGDYPELMTINQDTVLKKYIEAGALLPLDELFAKSGKNILKRHEARLADYKSSKYTSDGKLYWIGYWNPDMSFKSNPPLQMSVRSDLIEAIKPERLLTSSDYINFFKKALEMFPKTSDGKKAIGISMPLAETWGMDSSTVAWGTGAPYHQFTGQTLVTYDYSQKTYVPLITGVPAYKSAIKFMNDLYQIGALDTESFAMKYDQYSSKMKTGNPMGTYFFKWEQDGFNAAIKDKGIAYVDMPLMLDEAFESNPLQYVNPFDLSIADPSLSVVITKNCKYPERVVELLDYVASEEGQVLLGWGQEGVDYKIQDGKRVPTTETINNSKSDPDYWMKQGIIEPLDMFGLTAATDANGQNYIMRLDSEYTKAFMSDIKKNVYAKYGWTSPMDPWTNNKAFKVEFPRMTAKLVPDPASETGKKVTFWLDYNRKTVAKLYLAKNDDEFEKIWVEYVKMFNEQKPELIVKEFNDYMNANQK